MEQFQKENHLRWDSLGEFLALSVSLEYLSEKTGNTKAKMLGWALDKAAHRLLENGKSPSRKVGELDSRGSHFYLSLYWAEVLSEQEKDQELRLQFSKVASELRAKEGQIVKELEDVQGSPVDMGGYFHPVRASCQILCAPAPH